MSCMGYDGKVDAIHTVQYVFCDVERPRFEVLWD